jgi:hypothetical protein
MTSVQLIEVEIEIEKIDDVLAEAERWFEETDGRRTQIRELITRERAQSVRGDRILRFLRVGRGELSPRPLLSVTREA